MTETHSSRGLFEEESNAVKESLPLAEGAVLLRNYAAEVSTKLIEAFEKIIAEAPLRHMITPSGHRMSAAMANCGDVGWVSDKSGYRYSPIDPATGHHWPAMPDSFLQVAQGAAAQAGFPGFTPDACLMNRYEPGARLTLHQDKDEIDLEQPIVSVSLGLPVVFLFGGLNRRERPRRIRLESGDVAVWGGPSRLVFHGVAPLEPGVHPLTGACRVNLTFRRAL